MIALLFAAAIASQAVPQSTTSAEADPAQANAQAALDGMAKIFTTLGSCERHFTQEQVQGVRRGFEPAPGQSPSPLQLYIASAYERGKADTSLSAPACQEVMRALAQAKGRTEQ